MIKSLSVLVSALIFSAPGKLFAGSDSCLLEEANKLRVSAFELHKQGWNGLAVKRSKEAIEAAMQCEGINIELIESYDDTGLYYYLIEEYNRSVYYQLVATVLSENIKGSDSNSVLYKKRLGWALNKYSVDIGCVDNLCNATRLLVTILWALKVNWLYPEIFNLVTTSASP